MTPGSVRVAIACSIGLGLLLTVETGLFTPVYLSLALGVALYAIGELPDPEPVRKTHKVRRPGMTEREVYRRLTMSNVIQELKKEEREKARRKAKRKRGGS